MHSALAGINPNMYEDYMEGSAIQQAVKLSGVNRFICIGELAVCFTRWYSVGDSFPTDNPFVPGSKSGKDHFIILKEEKELTGLSLALRIYNFSITTGKNLQNTVWVRIIL